MQAFCEIKLSCIGEDKNTPLKIMWGTYTQQTSSNNEICIATYFSSSTISFDEISIGILDMVQDFVLLTPSSLMATQYTT